MNVAIKIMTLFSINVAWVMGSFKTVPRQAQVICFFEVKQRKLQWWLYLIQ